jgi:hypothetical protein
LRPSVDITRYSARAVSTRTKTRSAACPWRRSPIARKEASHSGSARETEDSEPGRPSRSLVRLIPNGENAPKHVVVYGNAKGQGDLLRDPWTTPGRFRCFIWTTAAMTSWFSPFGPGFFEGRKGVVSKMPPARLREIFVLGVRSLRRVAALGVANVPLRDLTAPVSRRSSVPAAG